MTITRISGLLYGGDYNPEQWPEHIWRQDARLMREAGINLVTVGVFSWALLQPEPERFDFAWLDAVLDLLAEHGIAVGLATGTASPPAWLVRRHPEILPMTADGVRLEFGSRQHYCPSSPEFRSAAARLVEQVAERYRGHPAVAMWHIGNEYGDELSACFCSTSADDFRSWLRERYGDLEALNAAWGTRFWSQRYGRWEEIAPPRAAPGPVNPTQQLDWQRFSSDALLACYDTEKRILDRICPGTPVTTNFMGMFKPLDYWTWAGREDIVSDDAYPDPADPRAHVDAALRYDLMRSLAGGRPWLLMEQAPSAVSWREVNVPKRPGLMRLWSLQSVARGADGVMAFQWRASRAGAEKFHSALLPHRGTHSRGWRETVRLGEQLGRLAEVAGSCSTASVAIVLDWNSWWAVEVDQHPSARLRWRDVVASWYVPLFGRNIAVDFVSPTADFDAYTLVLAPNLYLLTEETARRIASYVERGGHLAVGYFSGVVDEHDHVHAYGAPGPLRDVLGVVIDEWWPVPDDVSLAVHVDGHRGHASLWAEWLDATTAHPVATYADGDLASRPAVTMNQFGSGVAWYISCHLDENSLDTILDGVLARARVERVAHAPEGVEVTRRVGDGASYLFMLNHTSDEAIVAAPAPGMIELLTGERAGEHIALPPLGAAVLRECQQATSNWEGAGIDAASGPERPLEVRHHG